MPCIDLNVPERTAVCSAPETTDARARSPHVLPMQYVEAGIETMRTRLGLRRVRNVLEMTRRDPSPWHRYSLDSADSRPATDGL